jgi:hypothetical protein
VGGLGSVSGSVSGLAVLAPEGAVTDEGQLRREGAEQLARLAVFGAGEEREAARATVRSVARRLGIYPASMDALYAARAAGAYHGFTVPAINLRVLTFDAARAAFRQALEDEVGPLVFEIARSEMGYTDQRPAEYAACVLAAALAEGYRGPVFLQGDHFQVNPARPRDQELEALRRLIDEALAAGFFNIDIDASTVVDLSLPSVAERQEENGQITALLASHVRRRSPPGVVASIGGEIGEVGKVNSTEEDLRAFLDAFSRSYRQLEGDARGLSKVSVQTGTSHGGIPLPDGRIQEVALDFTVHQRLGPVAREAGLGGTVQHGASTLPPELFDRFPEVETLEVHLATQFQNLTFEHLPEDLKQDLYRWLHQNLADERRPEETDAQFIYRNRKRVFGPFKRRLWDLPAQERQEIRRALQEEFALLFRKLRVTGTRPWVERYAPDPGGMHPGHGE